MADPRLGAIEAKLAAADVHGARALADSLLNDAGIAAALRAAGLILRSRTHERARDPAAAIADLEAAIAITPGDARVWNDLGILRADAGDAVGALAAFRGAVASQPGHARSWNNLGNALRNVGELRQAIDAFARATDADAGYALAWANLGATQRDFGDEDAAARSLGRALALDPRQRLALVALAGLERARGAIDAAAALCGRAIDVEPRDANLWLQLAGTLAERDDLEAAARAYAAAEARDPALLRATLGRLLALPMVADDAPALVAARERFVAGLAELERSLPERAGAIAPERTLDECRWTNFLLAYHGEDDTRLQARYATLIANLIEARAPGWREVRLRRVRAEGERIRVGFLSAFFRDGTVGRYFERWITDLPRERFEVVVYHLQPGQDVVAQRLADRADAFHHCPRWAPARIAAAVRAAALDALVYPELGMDATTFTLAATRLAPLQVAGWGHPVTTGHTTVDVFLSVATMEPPGAQAHYTERLIPLPGIGTRYDQPRVPALARPERFGLPPGVFLFLCPQSLFKIHPGNDALYARVLAAAPQAHLVVFEGRHPALTAKYLARLDRACRAEGVDRAARVHVLPQCGHLDYLELHRVCGAMLDTLRWSGGNTSLDALACGLPIVTLPGAFMRGRQSAAMLELAGVPELVARDEDDYVRIATRLASDAGFRNGVSERIAAGRSHLFDDAAPIEAFAAFLTAEA